MGLDIQRDLSSLLQHLKRQFWLLQTSRLLCDHCYHVIKVQKMPLSRSEYWFSKIIIALIHLSPYLISLKHANDNTGEC